MKMYCVAILNHVSQFTETVSKFPREYNHMAIKGLVAGVNGHPFFFLLLFYK